MNFITALSVIGSTIVSKTISKGSNPLEFGKHRAYNHALRKQTVFNSRHTKKPEVN